MVVYRLAPRRLVYVVAGLVAVPLLAAATHGTGTNHGVGGGVAFGVIVALGVLGIVGCVLWFRGSGVRVCDAGIVSVGLSRAEAIRWQDLDHFEIDRTSGGLLAVYAVLMDTTRVRLDALRGRGWQRARLEEVSGALTTKLEYEHAHLAAAPRPLEPFDAVPLGWRRRVHGANHAVPPSS